MVARIITVEYNFEINLRNSKTIWKRRIKVEKNEDGSFLSLYLR